MCTTPNAFPFRFMLRLQAQPKGSPPRPLGSGDDALSRSAPVIQGSKVVTDESCAEISGVRLPNPMADIPVQVEGAKFPLLVSHCEGALPLLHIVVFKAFV